MRKFNNEVLWKVTVDVNGKQEYNINETIMTSCVIN